MEGGISRGVVSSYTTGDVLTVGLQGGTVVYAKNGATVYVSSLSPGFPLFAAAQLFDTGATLGNVVVSGAFESNVQWTGETGTSAGGTTLTKTDGTATWNAQASATKSVTLADGYLEVGVLETTTSRMVGLTEHESTPSFSDIDYAWLLAAGGTLHVYENGNYMGSFGSYATGDRLRVGVENGVVVYRRNGTLIFTSPTAPVLPLSVDTSLYTPGATIVDATIVP
jgi:hypothetical protein